MTYLLFGVTLLYGGYFINWLLTKDNKENNYDR